MKRLGDDGVCGYRSTESNHHMNRESKTCMPSIYHIRLQTFQCSSSFNPLKSFVASTGMPMTSIASMRV